MPEKRNYYRYHFKVRGIRVHSGITDNLDRREAEHQNSGKYTMHNEERLYWKDGHIVQIGFPVTKESALEWERDHGYGANQD